MFRSANNWRGSSRDVRDPRHHEWRSASLPRHRCHLAAVLDWPASTRNSSQKLAYAPRQSVVTGTLDITNGDRHHFLDTVVIWPPYWTGQPAPEIARRN